MKYQVRTCYAHPERLREGVNENGARVVERIPRHATRPAREFEVNCWWEDVEDNCPYIARAYRRDGHTVREVQGAETENRWEPT